MSKLHNMRGIEIEPFRAVSSGHKTLNELFGVDGFDFWVNQNAHLFKKHMYEPTSFLWHEDKEITWDEGRNVFVLALKDDTTAKDVFPYELIDFPGGLFLVATADESDPDDLEETISCMLEWIKESDIFDYGDFPKSGMCNMPNAEGRFDQALGIAQQQIYLPLKLR